MPNSSKARIEEPAGTQDEDDGMEKERKENERKKERRTQHTTSLPLECRPPPSSFLDLLRRLSLCVVFASSSPLSPALRFLFFSL